MSKKRPRNIYEVLAAILKTCEQRTKRTHIIYRANLSSDMLQDYVELALRAGLIEQEVDRSLLTTMKGRIFLRQYGIIRSMIEEEELQHRMPIEGRMIYAPETVSSHLIR